MAYNRQSDVYYTGRASLRNTDASIVSSEPFRSSRTTRERSTYDRSASLRGTTWDYQSKGPVDLRTEKYSTDRRPSRYGQRSPSGYPASGPTSPMRDNETHVPYHASSPYSRRASTSGSTQYNRRGSTGYDYSPDTTVEPRQCYHGRHGMDYTVPELHESQDQYPPAHVTPRYSRRASTTGHGDRTYESRGAYSPRMTKQTDAIATPPLMRQRDEEPEQYGRPISMDLSELRMEDSICDLLHEPSSGKQDYSSRTLDRDSSIPSMVLSETSSSFMDIEEDRWGNSALVASAPHLCNDEAEYNDRKLPPSPIVTSAPPKNQPAMSHEKSVNLIEIAPGHYMELRGTAETMKAIENDFYAPCSCMCCNMQLFCIQDASFVLCPSCRVVNPMEESRSNSRGVGMGFTFDELSTWQDQAKSRLSSRAQSTRW